MSKKYSTLLLIILISSGISACSFLFPDNKYKNTVWKSRNLEDGKDVVVLELNIYSRNRIKASFGKTKKEYLYYIEDNRIKVTNTQDYSQTVLKPVDGKLKVDPKYFGIKVADSGKEIELEKVSFSDTSSREKSIKEKKTADK
jgi:hypothetical protein